MRPVLSLRSLPAPLRPPHCLAGCIQPRRKRRRLAGRLRQASFLIELVVFAEHFASSDGVESLCLLTTTAAPFFKSRDARRERLRPRIFAALPLHAEKNGHRRSKPVPTIP